MQNTSPGNPQNNPPINRPHATPRFPLQRSSSRVLQAGFIAAACVLVLFLGCVLLSLRYSVLAQKAVSADDAQNHPANGQGTAGQPTPADLQKAIDAAVDESIKRDEALLDKMLLLVGAYSAILGVLALGTVFISRQEAQAQLKTVKEELAALSSQVRAEFPIISQLQNHLLDLIHKLEAKYPDKVDLNRARPDNWKTTLQQEDGLIDELQIVAVSVVVLDNNSLLKLYLVLAKMYLERFKTGKQNDGDAARGYHYAGRAIQCSANSDEAYRMRGLIGLSRYDLYAEAGKIVAANKDEFAAILSDANADFMRCIQLDRYNAGAYFNLAIIRDHEKNRPEAIALSERIIADRASVSRTEQEKYLPAIYINLACYLADDWEAETGDARKAELLRRILTLCTDGRDYLRATLQSNAALEDFKTNLELVLKNPKDLGKLPEDYKKPLTGLLE